MRVAGPISPEEGVVGTLAGHRLLKARMLAKGQRPFARAASCGEGDSRGAEPHSLAELGTAEAPSLAKIRALRARFLREL